MAHLDVEAVLSTLRGLSSGLRSASPSFAAEPLRCRCTASAGKNCRNSYQGSIRRAVADWRSGARKALLKRSSPPICANVSSFSGCAFSANSSSGEHLQAGFLAGRSSPDSSELMPAFGVLIVSAACWSKGAAER